MTEDKKAKKTAVKATKKKTTSKTAPKAKVTKTVTKAKKTAKVAKKKVTPKKVAVSAKPKASATKTVKATSKATKKKVIKKTVPVAKAKNDNAIPATKPQSPQPKKKVAKKKKSPLSMMAMATAANLSDEQAGNNQKANQNNPNRNKNNKFKKKKKKNNRNKQQNNPNNQNVNYYNNLTPLANAEEFEVSGVIKVIKPNLGILRDPAKSFQMDPDSPIIIPDLFNKYKLVEGASVKGMAVQTVKGYKVTRIDSICDLTPEDFKNRIPFKNLVALTPEERFRISDSGDHSMRIMDLVAPIGKGTRGLIVSPPKAGKTMLLEQLANSIRACEPHTRIIVLLVDERPEEVTLFRRQVDAEVFASCSDQSIKDHVELVELTLAHARAELECGKDIVILADSLTRMGRAFNNNESSRGRTMSGGVGVGALEIPRRFFGLARNVEDGGSITIIATALVDTGSKMDDLIFQEFKGTGNSELILDRKIAEARIFPAVNISASGTRREENLYTKAEYENIVLLHRALAQYPPQKALEIIKDLVNKFKTNEELLGDLKGKI